MDPGIHTNSQVPSAYQTGAILFYKLGEPRRYRTILICNTLRICTRSSQVP